MSAPTTLFVTVGTDHHPFDRLMDWVDDWAARHADVELIVQHGSTRPSRVGTSVSMLGSAELGTLYARADIVVSQVGPGTIADANHAGIRPIVVPRRAEFGEVVDDHQVAFGEFMASHERCVAVQTEAELHERLSSALADPSLNEYAERAAENETPAAVAVYAEELLARRARRLPSWRRLAASARGLHAPTP